MEIAQVVACLLFALGTQGFGHEFAWHGWKAFTRVFSVGRGLGGSFYSTLCIVAAIIIWEYNKTHPPDWVLVICFLLIALAVVFLYVLA
jgi:hypothetical protein